MPSASISGSRLEEVAEDQARARPAPAEPARRRRPDSIRRVTRTQWHQEGSADGVCFGVKRGRERVISPPRVFQGTRRFVRMSNVYRAPLNWYAGGDGDSDVEETQEWL